MVSERRERWAPKRSPTTSKWRGCAGAGGAGFPTAVKWRTVASRRQANQRLAVVINAAEGEPATFKDRQLLRTNPFKVLEGAVIGCQAVGASSLVVALKRSFEREIARVRDALPRWRQRAGSMASRRTWSKARASTSTPRRPRCSRFSMTANRFLDHAALPARARPRRLDEAIEQIGVGPASGGRVVGRCRDRQPHYPGRAPGHAAHPTSTWQPSAAASAPAAST
ncbi:MAG: hypothetical protein HYX32_04535 [Actinobacteria bacterium]|nr:hypothetical protein [Actinomycetota bacterium]